MHLKNVFPHVAIAPAAMSNFVQVVQKWLGTKKFVRTKSPIGSKYSKIFFWQLCTGGTVVVHLLFFSVASDGATAEFQIQNHIFWSILYHFQ